MTKIIVRNKSKQPKKEEKPALSIQMLHQRGVSNAGIAQSVYEQLEEDYGKKYLSWVKAAEWSGPTDVPLDEVSTVNRRNWEAMQDLDHVKDFLSQVKDGSVKPIILVNEPNNDKMMIADGHHRFLAAEKLNMPVKAYIATVGGVGGDWVKMHDYENDSNNGIASKQKSQQDK